MPFDDHNVGLLHSNCLSRNRTGVDELGDALPFVGIDLDGLQLRADFERRRDCCHRGFEETGLLGSSGLDETKVDQLGASHRNGLQVRIVQLVQRQGQVPEFQFLGGRKSGDEIVGVDFRRRHVQRERDGVRVQNRDKL